MSRPKPCRRLAPEERRRLFVEEAVRFFAEVGFEGGTRQLAKRLGVTQPLLYRYFPTKDSLIQAVYQEVYLNRWRGEWDALLAARSTPLRARLAAFYRDYTDAIFTREWMRIYLFSGLKGFEINRWYIGVVEERVLRPVAAGLRAELGLPEPAACPLSEAEVEVAWTLHGGIFYYGVRKYIYGLPVPKDRGAVIDAALTAFFDGAPRVARAHAAATARDDAA